MGNFYVNFSVRQDDTLPVVEALRRARLNAIVTPPSMGFVVVFEKQSDTQDTEAIEQVGNLLSREVEAPVFAVLNHDDDVLCFWLFEQGRLVDSYNSCPDYFGETAEGVFGVSGDAQQLCESLSVPRAVEQVDSILRADDYVFAMDRHAALVEAMGLSSYAVGSGYRYVEKGEIPVGLEPDDLIRIKS
jgi:hypothetical protein